MSSASCSCETLSRENAELKELLYNLSAVCDNANNAKIICKLEQELQDVKNSMEINGEVNRKLQKENSGLKTALYSITEKMEQADTDYYKSFSALKSAMLKVQHSFIAQQAEFEEKTKKQTRIIKELCLKSSFYKEKTEELMQMMMDPSPINHLLAVKDEIKHFQRLVKVSPKDLGEFNISKADVGSSGHNVNLSAVTAQSDGACLSEPIIPASSEALLEIPKNIVNLNETVLPRKDYANSETEIMQMLEEDVEFAKTIEFRDQYIAQLESRIICLQAALGKAESKYRESLSLIEFEKIQLQVQTAQIQDEYEALIKRNQPSKLIEDAL